MYTDLANGKIVDVDAFGEFADIADKISTDGSDTVVRLESDTDVAGDVIFDYGTGDITFIADSAVTVKQQSNACGFYFIINQLDSAERTTVTVGENVTFQLSDNVSDFAVWYGAALQVDGTVTGGANWGSLYLFNGEHNISSTGTVSTGRVQVGLADFTVSGDADSDRTDAHIDTNYLLIEESTFTANNAIINAGVMHDSNNGGLRYGASGFNISDSVLTADVVTLKHADTKFNVTGNSSLNIGTLTGAITVEDAVLTESAINKGTVNIKGENTYEGDFNATYVYIGDWNNAEYDGSVDFGTDSNVNVSGQMIIGCDTKVAGANKVVFGDVDGKVVTGKVFTAADVSVRRDGSLVIANTIGENKISTMNVMGSVVIDNAKLSGEVQIGNSSYDIDAVMNVQNGAEVTLGGSSNSVVILGKSNGGIINVDDAVLTIKRCGSGGGYKTIPADTFVIGYNGGKGVLNLSSNAVFDVVDYNGDKDGGKMNVLVNAGSSINAGTGAAANISGVVENSGNIAIADSDTTFTASEVANGGKITVNGASFDVDKVTNSGSINVAGASKLVIDSFSGNAIKVAGKSVLTGNINADLNLAGDITLNASFDGAITGGKSLTVSVSDTTLQFDESSKIRQIYAADGVAFQKDDFLSNVAIKGAGKNALVSIADGALNGNKITDLYLNITDIQADGWVNANVDFKLIKQIEGMEVCVTGGSLYYYVDGEGKTFVLSKVNNGIKISAGENGDAAVENIRSFTVKEDDSNLADTDIAMAAGTATVKVSNGVSKNGAIDMMRFKIGNIGKSSNSGTNNFSAGNYTDVVINGTIELLGNITVGNSSNFEIKEDLFGQRVSQSIKLGNKVNGSFEAVDLSGGIDTFAAGNESGVVVNGNVSNVERISFGKKSEADILGDVFNYNANMAVTLGDDAELFISGNIDNGDITKGCGETVKLGKNADLTVGGNIVSLAGLTIGTGAQLTMTDVSTVLGTAGNNRISMGAGATFTAGTIDLKSGKNTINVAGEFNAQSVANVHTISVQKNSVLAVNGDITIVQKLTVANNSAVTAYDITGTGANDSIQIGNNSSWLYDSVNFGFGNDTVKIGSNSNVLGDVIDFGEGNNSLQIGNNNDFVMTDVKFGSGKDTVKLGNGDAVFSGSIDMGAGNDTITLGKGTTRIGSITFGSGKDTLSLVKDSVLVLGGCDIAELEVLKAARGSMLIINNGKDNGIDFNGTMTGSWKDAVIMDGEGDLMAGNADSNTNSGWVYANEWDLFELNLDANKTLTLESDIEAIEIQYSVNGGDWMLWDHNDGLSFNSDKYLQIRVSVDFEDKKNSFARENYSFTAKIA